MWQVKIGVILLSIIGCGGDTWHPVADLRPVDGMTLSDLLVADDMTTSSDLGACAGWPCKQDRDCPPTLCATATGFGICVSGTCSWR